MPLHIDALGYSDDYYISGRMGIRNMIDHKQRHIHPTDQTHSSNIDYNPSRSQLISVPMILLLISTNMNQYLCHSYYKNSISWCMFRALFHYHMFLKLTISCTEIAANEKIGITNNRLNSTDLSVNFFINIIYPCINHFEMCAHCTRI